MKRIHDETEADPEWQNHEFDPPGISWNIGINDHTRVVNMKAAQSICTVYFRPMAGMDADGLMQRAHDKALECGIEFNPLWTGKPIYMDPGSDYVREALELAGRRHPRTVAFGTDGAMLTELERLVVMGPGGHRPGSYPRRVDPVGPDREGNPALHTDDPPMVRSPRLRRTLSGEPFND